MTKVVLGIAVAVIGAVIDILLFTWAIGIEQDYLLPDMNLEPLFVVGALGALLVIGGLLVAFRSGSSSKHAEPQP